MQRRAFIASLAVTVLPIAAEATPEAMAAAIKQVTGDAPVRPGKVTLDIPPLVENGNTVPLTVSVESPMTEADHVKAIHVFNEKNPQPHVFNAWLSPGNGRAVIGTRIKLAGRAPQEPRLVNTCYSLAAPDYGFSIAGVYHPDKGQLLEVPGSGGISPIDADASFHLQESRYAESWFSTISGDVFG